MPPARRRAAYIGNLDGFGDPAVAEQAMQAADAAMNAAGTAKESADAAASMVEMTATTTQELSTKASRFETAVAESRADRSALHDQADALSVRLVAVEGRAAVPGPPGTDGQDGADGADGDPGPPGGSAHEAWLAAGNSGSVADFLAALVGAPGVDGRSVELRATGSAVEWRQQGGEWQTLVALSAITGPPGTPAGTGRLDALDVSVAGKAAASHTHDYAATAHTHSGFAVTGHGHADLAAATHAHADLAAVGHSHAGYAASAHQHGAADIASGTFAVGRLPVGSASGTVAAGDHGHALALSGVKATPVSLPALSIGATEVAITWTSALPSASYTVLPVLSGSATALGALKVGVKTGSQTMSGCTLVVTSTALLAINSGTVSAVAAL